MSNSQELNVSQMRSPPIAGNTIKTVSRFLSQKLGQWIGCRTDARSLTSSAWTSSEGRRSRGATNRRSWAVASVAAASAFSARERQLVLASRSSDSSRACAQIRTGSIISREQAVMEFCVLCCFFPELDYVCVCVSSCVCVSVCLCVHHAVWGKFQPKKELKLR